MRCIRIAIVGTSVARRVRPPMENRKLNLNYPSILQKILSQKFKDICFFVENFSFTRATVIDIWKKQDEIIRLFADFYILNLGVPDAATREIPFWYAQIIYYRKPLILFVLLRALHKLLFERFRTFFVKLRGKKQWIDEYKFQTYVEKLIKLILKETHGEIILIGIAPPSERIEKILPGTYNNYQKYNQILKQIANKFNLPFVDISDLNQYEDYPDGIHFSYQGHKKVAEKLAITIEKILKNSLHSA